MPRKRSIILQHTDAYMYVCMYVGSVEEKNRKLNEKEMWYIICVLKSRLIYLLLPMQFQRDE